MTIEEKILAEHARAVTGADTEGCMTAAYAEFIQSKRHLSSNYGIDVSYTNPNAFDYQNYVAEYAIKKGRCAVFLDTGLGKTLVELTVAENYIRKFNKPVLIITPLAVAFQFIKEAEKFGINDVEYSRDGKFTKKIVICNYERLDKFNADDFCAFILDESSILKNFDGAIKSQITAFLKKTSYRFLFTATPSPNDFVELGTSSEALGYMGYMDMLSKFFSNNEDTISPQKIGVKWTLKPHATRDFFAWVSGWSISMRKPSDLGFSDERHVLPELITNHNAVTNKNLLCINSQFELLPKPSSRLTEVRDEQKGTITERCEKAVELAASHDVSVYWTNFNQEAELIGQMDKDAHEVKGSMNIDKKEEILMGFANGDIKKLITKPKITAFGLNWQHCNHTVYFPTFSYEQYYQSIRRFWRFGQKKPVTVDLVYSEGQEKVVQSLLAKAEKANELFSNLNASINAVYRDNKKEFDKITQLPTFLRA